MLTRISCLDEVHSQPARCALGRPTDRRRHKTKAKILSQHGQVKPLWPHLQSGTKDSSRWSSHISPCWAPDPSSQTQTGPPGRQRFSGHLASLASAEFGVLVWVLG